MLKKLKNPIFLILIIFLATLIVRIVYNNPPHYIYDWLMGAYAIRLIGRTMYEKYQNNHRTSIIPNDYRIDYAYDLIRNYPIFIYLTRNMVA